MQAATAEKTFSFLVPTKPIASPSHLNLALWSPIWALLLSWGWLLPNHYHPWTGFHMDAWIAGALLLASAVLICRQAARTPVHGMAVLAAVLLLVPWLQYGAGLLVFAGNAWVSMAYLAGFLLALLTGARWETIRAGQMADYLFLAVGIAAVTSVGLQLHQWLALDRLDIWSMGEGLGRPFANFGQPNQLGTFLVWGLLALVWAHLRGYVGAAVAIGAALYLLFGLALTTSRTAWIAMALLLAAAWWWRRLWPTPRMTLVVSGLAAYFVLCTLSMDWLTQALMGGGMEDQGFARIAGESRPAIWKLFLDAALQRPWSGYGWNQVAMAHMAVALDHPALNRYFTQAHNLFLDLVLWCGIPIGLLVSAWLLWWFWRRVRCVSDAETAVLVLLVLVVANHAMLELPLHYAYFLLPVGMVVGALDVRMGVRPVLQLGRPVLVAAWLASALLLSLIVRDYARVEVEIRTLRFEWANIKTQPAQPPDVVVLTQWRDYVRMARVEPARPMTDAELQWMRDIAALYPNAGFFQLLAIALAWNRQPEEAALWLSRFCKVSSQYQCRALKAAWQRHAAGGPEAAAVPWPR